MQGDFRFYFLFCIPLHINITVYIVKLNFLIFKTEQLHLSHHIGPDRDFHFLAGRQYLTQTLRFNDSGK